MRPDDDARQALLTLEPHEVIGENRYPQDEPTGTMGDNVLPVLGSWIGERRLDDLEVLGSARIGADDQSLSVMLDVVANTAFSPGDEPRGSKRLGEVNEMSLARIVVADMDDKKSA